MHLVAFLATALPLVPLAALEACVAGGPADQVAAAKVCCKEITGSWYGPYENQGICVLPDWGTKWYNLCVSEVKDSKLDIQCIPGDGAGLTLSAESTTATVTDAGSVVTIL
ncbi:hypothetical protein NA56DRAFT_652353 [Hyaloscypha hepaticicola]|uniref:Uncharacterized protein n=1 Tax=Hyaloscypha hepaticicola TaxID=2082293 RepID=A0A2J6PF41_9HELO|nr:hypothetical protein NA56DRAFT_652353 [Hyaloscypha hepaticicola]